MVYNIKDSTILLKGDVMLDNRTITFLTVCKEMNYTRAAEKLNISQPAVSQHIQYMEDYYGVRLFRFIGKKLILTDAGGLLQRSLTAFHNNEIYLKEQLSFINDKKQTLRFGATLTVGDFMIARPLSDFLSKHKGADISVTVANTKELLQKLDSGEIDFAILEGDYPKTLYNHQPYIIDNFIPICGKKYPFAAPPARLSDLIGERLILRESGSGTRMILEHMLIENGISLEDFSNVITIGNMNAIKDMVIAGCGITFLYETAVLKELRSGIIKKLDLADCRIQHEISIVWKRDNLFEDSFKELFEDLFQIC